MRRALDSYCIAWFPPLAPVARLLCVNSPWFYSSARRVLASSGPCAAIRPLQVFGWRYVTVWDLCTAIFSYSSSYVSLLSNLCLSFYLLFLRETGSYVLRPLGSHPPVDSCRCRCLCLEASNRTRFLYCMFIFFINVSFLSILCLSLYLPISSRF